MPLPATRLQQESKPPFGVKVDGPRIRKIINHIRLNGLVPGLMATSEGYYIATTPEELDEYMKACLGASRPLLPSSVALKVRRPGCSRRMNQHYFLILNTATK